MGPLSWKLTLQIIKVELKTKNIFFIVDYLCDQFLFSWINFMELFLIKYLVLSSKKIVSIIFYSISKQAIFLHLEKDWIIWELSEKKSRGHHKCYRTYEHYGFIGSRSQVAGHSKKPKHIRYLESQRSS